MGEIEGRCIYKFWERIQKAGRFLNPFFYDEIGLGMEFIGYVKRD